MVRELGFVHPLSQSQILRRPAKFLILQTFQTVVGYLIGIKPGHQKKKSASTRMTAYRVANMIHSAYDRSMVSDASPCTEDISSTEWVIKTISLILLSCDYWLLDLVLGPSPLLSSRPTFQSYGLSFITHLCYMFQQPPATMFASYCTK
jgi:hypothetical protein